MLCIWRPLNRQLTIVVSRQKQSAIVFFTGGGGGGDFFPFSSSSFSFSLSSTTFSFVEGEKEDEGELDDEGKEDDDEQPDDEKEEEGDDKDEEGEGGEGEERWKMECGSLLAAMAVCVGQGSARHKHIVGVEETEEVANGREDEETDDDEEELLASSHTISIGSIFISFSFSLIISSFSFFILPHSSQSLLSSPCSFPITAKFDTRLRRIFKYVWHTVVELTINASPSEFLTMML